MRTYLIDRDDKSEFIIDLTKTIIHSRDLLEFEYSTLRDHKLINLERVFVRKLAGRYFVSQDQKKWEKLARQNLPKRMLNIDKVFDIYRGYKPSGLSEGAEGELLTKMPGKVVKILVKEGQEVEKGQTLLILEAMKMENEINSNIAGRVKAIHVKEGDALDQGVLMFEVEPI